MFRRKDMNLWVKQIPFIIALILSFCFCGTAWAQNAVMIIAKKNFRDEELLQPKEILEKEGIKVTIASSSLAKSRGMLGTVVKPDITLDQVKVNDYDIVIFVGGTGASEYFYDPKAHKIAQEAANKGKVLGAICIAPVILANAGILKGRNATVWSSEHSSLEAQGAHYTGKPVEVDGMIVSADGPKAAKEFGSAIVRCLKK